ncbi:hypothetical protein Baya_12334 [Bagarius yarrelli]|uniref:Uncharacterized protein n=1 Tax=Bagarius yarrelli TaxID=175774 RepID=A0A556V356_BAGYA|nr:hypothetical protein Baya_12334 [Bagarius yarrelli]
MDMVVCVVWTVLLLMYTPRYKAESPALVPVSATASQNDAVDPFVTSKMTDPEEPITMDSLSSARQHISKAQGATTTFFPAMTSILTKNHVNTKITDTITDATVGTGTGVIWPQESVTNPKTLTNATQGSSDITPFLIPRSTTITPGSPIPTSTNLNKVHQNSSQSTSSKMIPTEYLSPSSSSPSTLEDLITGSVYLGKEEDQNEPSEFDVGDEDSIPSPSPLDPLLAGLISIFIISTAMLFIILFLKFRQQDAHPEFHRLQDLPMVRYIIMLLSVIGVICKVYSLSM